MSRHVRLDQAGPEDAPALQALHAPLFDPPWTAEGLAAQLASPGSSGLLARAASGELLGFILFRRTLDEAEILILAVDPGRRRAGVGRALVEAALALAEAGGACVMWLEVAVDNAAALALYARTGFCEAGRRPLYYQRRTGGPVDALLLRRELDGGERLTGPARASMLAR